MWKKELSFHNEEGAIMMYLHIGNDMLVNKHEIIGIFDLDNTTVSRLGKRFLPNAQKNGKIVYATDDLPKSFIITENNGNNLIYISSMSTQVLMRRFNESDL